LQVNFLFDKPIARVGGLSSSEPEITEYSVKVDVPELGLQNSQLRIIDTPGLGSSEGLEQDARVLASLRHYIRNHDELGRGGIVPNVVLIFSKFDDNRIEGQSSYFVKMLSGYDQVKDLFLQQAPTNSSSNVLYVFSGLLRETDRVSRKPGPKLEIFKSVIRNFTTFPEPILLTVAENEAREEELEEVDGNFKLPNKELYPQNVIDKMLQITKQCNDSTGTAIIESVMSRRREVEVRVRRNGTMAGDSEISVQETLELLALRDFHVDVTEVSEALQLAYGNIDPQLRTAYPNSLVLTQRSFQILGVSRIDQIPKTPKEVIGLLQKLHLNPGMLALVQETFQIVIPEMPFEQLTGYGYDVLGDEALKSTPFDFEELHFSKELGCMIPVSLSTERLSEEVEVLNFYDSEAEYAQRRLEQLDVQEKVNNSLFKGEFLPGENVISSWNPALGSIQLTASKELRNFRLTLNSDPKWSEMFKEDLEVLPTYDLHDRESVKDWRGFFRMYGTHVVHLAFGGGSIETAVAVTLKNGTSNPKALMDRTKMAIQRLPQYTSFLSGSNVNIGSDGDLKISLTGGDYAFKSLNLKTMEPEKSREAYKGWRDSLTSSPIMLNSKLRLVPLSELIRPLNYTLSQNMEGAAENYLQGSLVYTPSAALAPIKRDGVPVVTRPVSDYSEIPELNIKFEDYSLLEYPAEIQPTDSLSAESRESSRVSQGQDQAYIDAKLKLIRLLKRIGEKDANALRMVEIIDQDIYDLEALVKTYLDFSKVYIDPSEVTNYKSIPENEKNGRNQTKSWPGMLANSVVRSVNWFWPG
jgi:hypothetical protein